MGVYEIITPDFTLFLRSVGNVYALTVHVPVRVTSRTVYTACIVVAILPTADTSTINSMGAAPSTLLTLPTCIASVLNLTRPGTLSFGFFVVFFFFCNNRFKVEKN